jgi:hypothetical protein
LAWGGGDGDGVSAGLRLEADRNMSCHGGVGELEFLEFGSEYGTNSISKSLTFCFECQFQRFPRLNKSKSFSFRERQREILRLMFPAMLYWYKGNSGLQRERFYSAEAVCGASDLERLLFWILKRMIEMMNELWF